MAKLITILIALLFIAVGVVLGLLNPQVVHFDGYFAQVDLPLSVLMAIAFMIGLVLGGFLLFSQILALQWRIGKLTREARKREKEISELNGQILAHKQQVASKVVSETVQNLPASSESPK
jgi:putative membrane protein